MIMIVISENHHIKFAGACDKGERGRITSESVVVSWKCFQSISLIEKLLH